VKLNKLPWRSLLLLLFAIALLLWVSSTVSLRDALATLAELRARDLWLLAGVNLLVLTTFTARWWLLLAAQGLRIPYWRLMAYRLTAFGISYFTPGSHFGGEPYQVFAVSRWHGAPVPISLAAVTLDKVLEMLINLAFLVGGILALLTLRDTVAPWVGGQLILYALLLLAIPCALLLALWQGRHPFTGLITFAGRFLRRPLMQSKWAQTLHQSEAQAVWLCRHHPRTVILAFLTTLLTWIGVIGEFWFLTSVLGMTLTPMQITVSLVAARIAILLPVPAGLGALEAGQVLAMETLGMDPSIGIAIAVLIRGRDVVSGLVGLALGGAHIWQRVEPVEHEWPATLPENAAPAAEPHQSTSPP
jgi:uncharacterized protein (TIRG00374 family)